MPLPPLHFLPRSAIDDARWDQAVDQAPQGLPYAYSWYLDAMADGKWGALVEENYARVLPLPHNRKLLGLAQVYPPLLMQQTGVMGAEVDAAVVGHFLQQVPRRFRRIALKLNEQNPLPADSAFTFAPRTNLLLDLRPDYETLQQGYDKSLRRRLRKARKHLSVRPLSDPLVVIDLYRTQLEGRLHLGAATYRRAEAMMQQAIGHEKGYLLAVEAEGTMLGAGFFLRSHGRLINLFGASNEAGRKAHAMHRLLDHLVETHAGQPWHLDFEGSDVPAIARFFQSFGSQPRTYHLAQLDRAPGWLRWAEKQLLTRHA